jgi:hypothetical protein
MLSSAAAVGEGSERSQALLGTVQRQQEELRQVSKQAAARVLAAQVCSSNCDRAEARRAFFLWGHIQYHQAL